MSKETFYKILSGVFGVLLVITLVLLLSKTSTPSLGGTIHNVAESFDAGIKVNGTSIINSSGQYTGTVTGPITSANSGTFVYGSATSTIAAGSSSSGTNKGKLCLWNGTQFSVLSFAAGSTSTSIATSTTCQ